MHKNKLKRSLAEKFQFTVKSSGMQKLQNRMEKSVD